MPKGLDSKIQARVRILLARRWIDLRSVTIGTTNGVVYIGGELRASGGPAAGTPNAPSSSTAAWRERIQREIAALPDVRDVVFRLGPDSTGGECPPKAA